MAAIFILIGAGLLLSAVLLSPREPTKSERQGVVTDCQRDPLRRYGRLRRGRTHDSGEGS